MVEKVERWPRKHTPPIPRTIIPPPRNAEFYRFLIEEKGRFHDEGSLQGLDTATWTSAETFLKETSIQRSCQPVRATRQKHLNR